MKGYPSWFSVTFIVAVIFALFLTGAVLIPNALEARFAFDIPWSVSGNTRLVVVALHLAVGFLTFAMLGALWVVHMRSGWAQKRRQKTGLLLILSFIFLGVSGMGLLYVGNAAWLLASSASHTFIGILISLFFIRHAYGTQ
jgi:hypothetical protein